MSRYSYPRPFRSLLLLTVVASLSLLLAACGKTPVSTPAVVVIVPSATANEPAPELSAANRAMLQSAGATSTQADAYIVNPTPGQPTEVPLTPRRADGQVEYGPRRGLLLDQNVSRVSALLRSEAASGPFDLLGMIAAGVRVTSPPGTLLILSSGLSTAGGFDLRVVGWGADPASIAGQLKQRGHFLTWPAGVSSSLALAIRPAGSRHCRCRSARPSRPTGWPSAELRQPPDARRTR